MKGSGITRLDTILSNGVATHAVGKVTYDFHNGKGFDHVPINLELNEERFQDEIDTPALPAALVLRTLTGTTQAERNKTLKEEATWFAEVWQWHRQDFDSAIQDKNVDEAHRIWCLAAEHFLWKCQRIENNHSLPKHKPRRGQAMPTIKQQVTGRLCKETGIARNAFTSKVDNVLGIAHDLLMRIRRLVKGPDQLHTDTNEKRNEQSEHLI
jgi:hypothetical protein